MKLPRNEAEIEKIRKSILEHALDIILSSGLDALTMRALGKKTGMTAPNLYNYFRCKEEIYITIVINGYEMLLSQLEKAAKKAGESKKNRLRNLIDAYFSFGIEKPLYYEIIFSGRTPKHNDYIGTQFEKLSLKEYEVSMKIADIAVDTAGSFLKTKEKTDPEKQQESLRMRVVQIWSLLHGMILLNNSGIINYVEQEPELIFNKIIDDFIVQIMAD
jgi:AcrR family transcriptional regulator